MLSHANRELIVALEQERLRHAARRYQIHRLRHETGRTLRQRATRMMAAVPPRTLRWTPRTVGPRRVRSGATSPSSPGT